MSASCPDNNPYGKFRLDMDRRLDLDLPSVA
jgi:hypothetical protein